jgi:hypothetical protein
MKRVTDKYRGMKSGFPEKTEEIKNNFLSVFQ